MGKQGRYTLPFSPRPPVFMKKDVFEMTPVERMVAAGMAVEGTPVIVQKMK